MVSHSAVFALPRERFIQEFKHWVCSKKQTYLSAFGTWFFFLTGIVSLQTEMYGKKSSDRSDRKVYRGEELCANWIIY